MKFNKDTFSSNVANHVQNAIDKNIITKEDRSSNNIDRLHGFIQYELLEYCKDRSFAIDVLRAVEFDQTRSWSDLQNEFGEFKSLLDIALVDLFLYLKSLGLTEFSAYKFDNQKDSALLDLVHDKTDMNTNAESGDTITLPSEDSVSADNNPDEHFLHRDEDDNDGDELGVDDFNSDETSDETSVEPEHTEPRPRRKIRLAR